MKIKTKIINVLKKCFDPEIPIDLWNLGLIYDIKIIETENNKNNINILMSLTTPGCTMGNSMAEDIKTQISELEEVNETKVEVTFDPPWKPEMMTSYAREKLGFDPTPKPDSNQKINVEWE